MKRIVNKRTKRTASLALAALAVAALALVAAGPAAASPTVASMSASATSLDFTPEVPYKSLVMNVSGGGRVTTQEFAPGEPVQLDVSGLADGHYTYELRVMPEVPAALMAEMESRRGPGGLEGEVPAELEPLVQSGYVTVAGGMVVREDLPEEPASRPISMSAPITSISAADFVILDDLIVDGSACIGFDCVNGESFGFDTLRLKENNLRIKFDDTSTAASYPDNDWQLTANDSANGGANKFSIDDISGGRTPFTVEANARSHSLYVDDGGRIGNRTSTPSTEIHTIDGDTPTLRLQQDGSSGFTPQTWDVAGNETNFFVRDVTNGSQLPFRIRPGAPTSSIFIDVNGDVGVGTSSPEDRFHVSVAGPARYKLTNTTITNSATDDQDWIFNSNGTLRISAGSDAPEFTLDASGNLTLTGTITVPGGTLPDYVFDAEYSLMPLSELAAFVEQNKHLPRIPSASEIEESGQLNMTEMQLRLLEKVEELTLYTLAQQDTITGLMDQNAALKSRLDALEALATAANNN